MHIGLIGGIGPAATEFYYRGLISAGSATSSPMELTIAHADMNTLRANLAAEEPVRQAQTFCRHLEQLAAAGAEIAAVTSIAGHFCIREIEAISPLPLVDALATISDELNRRGLRRIGLLGSVAAMESSLYGTLAGFDVVLPQGADLKLVGEEYFAMAAAQQSDQRQRELFFSAGAELCSEQGAEAVLLAGTDLFLAFSDATPGFEVIDSAEVHIQALALLAHDASVKG